MGLIVTIDLAGADTAAKLRRLDAADLVVVDNGELTVAAVPLGTETGKPAVAFVFQLPDGRTVLAQTSLRLFQVAAGAFRGRYGSE